MDPSKCVRRIIATICLIAQALPALAFDGPAVMRAIAATDPRVQSRRFAAEAAYERVRVAAAAMAPKLDLSGSARSDIFSEETVLSLGLRLRKALYSSERGARYVETLRAEHAIAVLDVQQAAQDRIAGILRLLSDRYASATLIEMFEQQIAATAFLLDGLNALAERGEATSTDVNIAEAKLANWSRRRLLYLEMLEQSRTGLSDLSPETLRHFEGWLSALQAATGKQGTHKPMSVRLQLARIKAAEARVALVSSLAATEIALHAELGAQAQGDAVDDGTTYASIAIVGEINFGANGARDAALREARHRLSSEVAALRAVARDAETRRDALLAGSRADAASVAAREAAVSRFREALFAHSELVDLSQSALRDELDTMEGYVNALIDLEVQRQAYRAGLIDLWALYGFR